jgi:hypothetical protein
MVRLGTTSAKHTIRELHKLTGRNFVKVMGATTKGSHLWCERHNAVQPNNALSGNNKWANLIGLQVYVLIQKIPHRQNKTSFILCGFDSWQEGL